MRSRFMAASAVTEADEFYELSIEAQATYFHLLASASVDGAILGARRLVRGMGFADDVVDELLAAGYLLEVRGTIYDRYCWRNSKFSQRMFDRMKENEDYVAGHLEFEGEPGRSAYTTPERRRSVAQAAQGRCKGGDAERTKQGKAPAPALSPANHPQGNSPSVIPPGDFGVARCTCLRCGGVAETWEDTETGRWLVNCPSCGETYDYQAERQAQAPRA